MRPDTKRMRMVCGFMLRKAKQSKAKQRKAKKRKANKTKTRNINKKAK